MDRPQAALSAYGLTSANLIAMGYSPIPILPRDKAPGEVKLGRWGLAVNWQRFRDRQPTAIELSFWNEWADSNVGIILGTKVTVQDRELQLVAVDIDTDDFDMLRALEGSLPLATVRKRGRKGFTAFFLATPETKTRRYAVGPTHPKKVIAELLTGNATRQTVIPPSLHPAGIHYKWETDGTLENTPIKSLPFFSADDLERFEDTLASLGWNKAEEELPAPSREARGVEGENVWRECNEVALKNLAAWVPALQLPKFRSSGGGYQGVAFWRASSTGRALRDRNPNLGISDTGIRDFGTGKGYSPLDLVIAVFGWSLDDAFQWLSERLGTLIQPVAMKAPLARPDAKRPEVAFNPETGEILDEERPRNALEAMGLNIRPAKALPAAMPSPKTGDIPIALTRVPGLVGDVTDWIDATARRPNRGLALVGALAFFSALFGRQYSSPTDARTNNYIIGLGPSGSGKQHPLTQVQRLAVACGPEVAHLIGPENTMSLSSVVSALTHKPSIVFVIDEIGGYFKKILSPRSGSHEKQIKDILLSLFSKAHISWNGIEYAGKRAVPIMNPNLCLFGMSTKDEFYSAIDGGQVENGFLNRLLIFSASRSRGEKSPDSDPKAVPESIVQRIQFIVKQRGLQFSAASNISVEPTVVAWGLGGEDAFNECRKRVENVQIKRRSIAPFFARTAEHAIKLATVRAAGDNYATPEIDRACMEWAEELAFLSAFTMAREAMDLIASNPYEVDVMLVRKALRDLGGKASRNSLYRKVYRKLDSKKFNSILGAMMEASAVQNVVEEPEGGGPPATIYRLIEDDGDDDPGESLDSAAE